MNYSRKNRSRRGGGELHFKPVTLNNVKSNGRKVYEDDNGIFKLVNDDQTRGQEVYPDDVDDPTQFFDVKPSGGRRRKSRRRKCKSKRKRR